MLVIINDSTDCYFNLALEEHLFRDFAEDIFMLWRNDRTIVVGRNQNTLRELNTDYVRDHDIRVVRRLTGGGAVYHDLGNLNYTFIERGGERHFSDYARFTAPIIAALAELGVHAELSGRNDLLIDGKKISGNAQHAHQGSILHHGTLLFSSSMADISGALQVAPEKIRSKGIRSVESRVTNISAHLPAPCTLQSFQETILRCVLRDSPDARPYQLTQADRAAAERLVAERYGTWEWNFGSSPAYSFTRRAYTSCGLLDIHMDVREGVITALRIYGDYFGRRDAGELEQALTGCRHERGALLERLSGLDVGDYFSGLAAEQLAALLF